jgi:broad specificity phosphatase PhoE
MLDWSPDPEASWMFLLRHGATSSNLARPPRLQGRGVNLGLSDEGRQQAAAVSGLLAPFPLRAIYSSPLERAIQTARAIAAHHPDAPLRLVEPLIEVDVGAWEGLSWPEIEQAEPDYCRAFLADPVRCGYRDGESLQDVHRRVVPALQSLLRQHVGEAIAVVAHNVVNRCFVAELLEVPLHRAREISQDNCGVNLIRWKADRYKLVTMNAVFHLRANSVRS